MKSLIQFVRRNTRRSATLKGICLFLFFTLPAAAQQRVLFIGNSFTIGSGDGRASAAGGVPGIFDALARAGGNGDPETVLRGVGGMDFKFHAQDATTQSAIKSQQWSHVILQNYSTQPTHLASGSIDDHNTYGGQLYDQVIANNANSQVVLFETFSRSAAHSLITGTSSPTGFASTAEFQEEIRKNYAALADSLTAAHPGNLPVQVAPVGSAWENAGGMLASNAAGYVDLHSSDEYHGNDNGYYLAACVFYATIYGKSPEGLSVSAEVQALNLSLTEDAAALESAAWETVEPQVSKLEAGQVLRIDFGADATTMDAGDDGGNTWNNVTPAVGGTDDGVLEGLLTTAGTATNVNLEMLSRFNGANTAGTTTSAVFPADATSDSLFGNTEDFGGLTDVFPSFRITGLNPANTYTLTFYASRGSVGDNRQTRFTVTGDDEEVANLDAGNNVDETVTLAGIVPGDDGVITIAIAPGADNDNANHFTYLGALQIEGPALPVTEVLFDFGADAIQMEDGDDDEGNVWNNVTPAVGGVDGGALSDIVTSSGGATSLGLTVVNRFNGANTAGSTATDLFPADATNDSLFGNTELFGSLENVFPSFTLTGLDPTQAHSFTFFASRLGAGDNRETLFTLTGANTGSTTLNAADNETELTTLDGILPTAEGEITVALTPGDNNDNGNHFTYLGVMKVAFAGGGGGPLPDTTAPELVSTHVVGNIVTLVFNEPVATATAGTLGNYTVTADGESVQLDGAELDADGVTVSIELADTFIGQYTVSVTGVTDLAGNPIAAGSSINGVAPDPDAQFFLFDFGGGNFIEEDEQGNIWNNVSNGVADADEGILFDILDNTGATTDLAIEMIRRFNGVNTSGTLDNLDFPAEATGDSFYGNTEAFGVGPDIFPAFKFTGLDPLKAYALTFYASRMGAGDNRETGYTLTGANSGFVALNPAENIDQTATVQAMIPTAEGEITIEIAPTENNTNGNHFTYLGVLRLDVTEPVAGLKITEHPQSVSVNELDAASFSVAVEGEPPFSFKWFRNDEAIDGATGASYTIPSAPVSLSGSAYTVTVTNASGPITSDPAILTVVPDETVPTL
ncbi:MAG: Ig-like domain-containing protein, partial [Verrucomicrobiae bacterium]|nr:Ig-like domain-containing protein [Verrucomicrobiae bacterium]